MSEGHQYRISLCVDKSMFQLLDQSNSQVECYLVNKFLNKCLGTFSLASELASHSSHTRRYYPNTTHIGATNSSNFHNNSNNITPNVNLFATTLPTPHSSQPPQTSFTIMDNYYRQQPSRKRAVPVRKTFTAIPMSSDAKRPKASTVHHFPKNASLAKSDNQQSLNLISDSSDACQQSANDDAFVEDLALDLSTSHASPVKNECVQDDDPQTTEIIDVPCHAGRLNSEEDPAIDEDSIPDADKRCMRPLNLADNHLDEISHEFSPKNSLNGTSSLHASMHPAHATSQSEPCSPVVGTLGDRDKRISVTEFGLEHEDNAFVAEETPFDLSRTNFNLSRSSFGSSSDDLDETSNPAVNASNQITNLSKNSHDAISARQRPSQTFGPKFLSRSLDSSTNILSYSNGIDVKTFEKNNFASNTSINRFNQALAKEGGTSAPLSAFKRENVFSAHSSHCEDSKLFGSSKDDIGANENSSFILNYKSELIQAEFAEAMSVGKKENNPNWLNLMHAHGSHYNRLSLESRSFPRKCDLNDCDFMASNREIFKDHLRDTHPELKLFHCQLCKYLCKRKADLKRHYRTVHKLTMEGAEAMLDHVISPTEVSASPSISASVSNT